MCLSAVVYYCCVLWAFTNFHFVIISSFKRSDIGCVKEIVYYFPTCDHNRYSNETTLSSYIWHLKSVSSQTANLNSLFWDAFHILKYLKEMPLVLIWKTGNSYLSKPEGNLEQEIWTPL